MTSGTTSWKAVVLGGGDPNDPFALAHGAPVKALVDVAGRPMAAWVLAALRASGLVSRVVYVGPVTDEVRALADEVVPDAGSLLANLEAGVAALGGTGRVLVATADVPLLTGAMVRDVLMGAPDADLVYPIVRREDCEAAFPGVKRTYARLRDGTFTGGNLFLLDARLAKAPQVREVWTLRKRPFALARRVGLGALARLLAGRLTVAETEARVSRLLGASARALVTRHAAVGADVDKDGDLALARAALAGRTPIV